jgi:O-acetyl-ADP-ribose deacetylase (regulator of RNase III)
MSPRRTPLDIWQALNMGVACCIPVNCIVKRNGELVMGAGLAKAFAQRFPVLPMMLGMTFQQLGAGVHVVRCSENTDVGCSIRELISFPTKFAYSAPSDLMLIQASAKELLEVADTAGLKQVYLPKVGCGLGGLRWAEVFPILDEILDERFLIPEGDGE